ncbi:carbon-nitrogen family hydrolase [Paenibacillus sp. BR1-192]|uniref:carbon-nitrogen family hydrolase n=1 Tax=Paenibacillus sp. BR1-192 TaxID=3032287 RepID=UPI00240E2A8B|nr:carbon-nitrogen family hydrolase [Paenibacillus sp. BR1-192]WFB60947.1 carbon-nitrogen family hydrolase [Paenibacillus sp. BR1-192]
MTGETKAQLHIALIQADIEIGNVQANMDNMLAMMEKAAAANHKPDVIVLPEMWNTGYALDRIQELADPMGQETSSMLSEFARKHRIQVVGGSVAERIEDRIYNSMYVFNRNGEQIAKYSKIHLFRLMDEEKFLQAGQQTVTFDLEEMKAGASICYDIRFPELSRTLALGGAQVLFVPAEWPHPRLHHWRTLLIARAIENQMYVVACNRVGTSGETDFFGHSLIIDPWGEIIAEGDERETIVTGMLDCKLTDEVRGRIPVFEDRRPHLYFQ